MRICIVGAGAIGGYLGARLIHAGQQVTVIARGQTLAAIREHGLIVRSDQDELLVHPALVTDDMSCVGIHDVVIVAVKAHQLAAVAPGIAAISGPESMVIPAQNGIPWWYFQHHGGPWDGYQIKAVDPDGVIARHIPIERVIACVVYPAIELLAPGLIRHIEGDRFTLGEPDGSRSDRVQKLAGLLTSAGLKAPIRTNIRSDIWVKLWGNVAFNPISALTRATLLGICSFDPSRELVAAVMAETQAIAEQLGIRFGISIEQRIQGAAQVGEHKTSMLQDVEAGRTTEIDALVGAVAELGRLTGVATPHIDALYATVALLTYQR